MINMLYMQKSTTEAPKGLMTSHGEAIFTHLMNDTLKANDGKQAGCECYYRKEIMLERGN